MNIINKVKQFIKFGIVGVSNTVLSYGIYFILIHFHIYYLLASVAGFIVSVLNAYYWNNKYVFKKQESEERTWWKTLVKTFLSYAGTGLVLNNILLIVWVEFFSISERVAPVINLLVTVPTNYLMNKYWTFKNPPLD